MNTRQISSLSFAETSRLLDRAERAEEKLRTAEARIAYLERQLLATQRYAEECEQNLQNGLAPAGSTL